MATRQYLLPCPTSASSSGIVIPGMRKASVSNVPKVGSKGARASRMFICEPKMQIHKAHSGSVRKRVN